MCGPVSFQKVWLCFIQSQSRDWPFFYIVNSLHHSKEGWLRHKSNAAKPPLLAQTVVFLACFDRKTTPVSRLADAPRHFLDRSATPPCCDARRGVLHSCNLFTGS